MERWKITTGTLILAEGSKSIFKGEKYHWQLVLDYLVNCYDHSPL